LLGDSVESRYITDYRAYKFTGLSLDSLYYFPELIHPIKMYASFIEYPALIGRWEHPMCEGHVVIEERLINDKGEYDVNGDIVE